MAALSLPQGALSALETVLQAEQAHHLRAAAFSVDSAMRDQHRGVYLWLEEFLTGSIFERYRVEARLKLGLQDKPIAGAPGGSEWMESDGLSEEE